MAGISFITRNAPQHEPEAQREPISLHAWIRRREAAVARVQDATGMDPAAIKAEAQKRHARTRRGVITELGYMLDEALNCPEFDR